MTVVWIAIAGGLGTAARYGLSKWISVAFLPWGTLAANMLGCLLLAALYSQIDRNGPGVSEVPWRIILGVGFCGGFTTYSSFNWELFQLAETAGIARTALYLTVTLIGCAFAGWIGVAIGKLVA